MAGDWIKIRNTLPNDDAVYTIAEKTGLDPDAVIGRLVRIWIWADQQTTDGKTNRSPHWLDQYSNAPGFCQAMIETKWLALDEAQHIQFPNFERHNGTSSKIRAQSAVRQSRFRKNHGGKKVPKQQKQADPGPTVYPDWLPLDAWLQFVDARRQMGKRMTAHAKDLTIKKLAAFREQGHDPKHLIELAIERGWQGIYVESGRNGRPTPPEPTADELEAALQRERDARRP